MGSDVFRCSKNTTQKTWYWNLHITAPHKIWSGCGILLKGLLSEFTIMCPTPQHLFSQPDYGIKMNPGYFPQAATALKLQWISIILHISARVWGRRWSPHTSEQKGSMLHAILRIISRGVSGLATDSPCGVWGRGWTTCLLHDRPLFGSHFKMRVGM